MAVDAEIDLDLEWPSRRGSEAGDVARGVCRALEDMGYATLTEMRLGSGRRVDVIGLDRRGGFVIVEIKTSAADLRADKKWPEYERFCDRFYFAVPAGFSRPLLAEDAGVIVADRYGGAVVRRAPARPMHAATRRAQTLRFAHIAAARLRRAADPPV